MTFSFDKWMGHGLSNNKAHCEHLPKEDKGHTVVATEGAVLTNQ